VRLSIDALLDYRLGAPADLLMALEAAQTVDQILIEDRLVVDGVDRLVPICGEESLGRRTWARGAERVTARYTATLDVDRPLLRLQGLAEVDKLALPALVVPYLFPSRYCEADKFRALVQAEFCHRAGGAKVHAIAEWIRGHIRYQAGVSSVETSAADTYLARAGVCRDFAHLLAAMVRAADIPARVVAAYAWQLEPQDFHAVVEVWLDGAWHLVDATGLAPCDGIVRIGVGRDATDISFLTIFGDAELIEQRVTVERLDG